MEDIPKSLDQHRDPRNRGDEDNSTGIQSLPSSDETSS